MRHSQEWADTYQGFLEAGVPLLILNYDEMEDESVLRGQLLKISNFLHVPIKSSVFNCVVARSQDFDLKVTATFFQQSLVLVAFVLSLIRYCSCYYNCQSTFFTL